MKHYLLLLCAVSLLGISSATKRCQGQQMRYPISEGGQTEIHFCTTPGNNVQIYNVTDDKGEVIIIEVEAVCLETMARFNETVVRREKDEPITMTITPDGRRTLSTSMEKKIVDQTTQEFFHCYSLVELCPDGQLLLLPKMEGEEYSNEFCGTLDTVMEKYTYVQSGQPPIIVEATCNDSTADIVFEYIGPDIYERVGPKTFERDQQKPLVIRTVYDRTKAILFS